MPGQVWIGTSGWNYKSWAGGVFYPNRLPPARWLEFYSRHFASVEINNTFYRLPEKSVFEGWRRRSPAGFKFAVKASRFITHMKKLLQPEEHVANFLEHASGLGNKLAVVLFQLPPFWKFNCERLEALCAFLSRQTIIPGLRIALEVRNPSWLGDRCYEILREHNVALVLADWPGMAVTEPLTASFIFARRHGPQGLYSSDYSHEMLQKDAELISQWRDEGRDVYIYFNNDAYGFAVRNALTLKGLVAAGCKEVVLR